jgi:energy-coupling factor transport system permease protein
MIVPRAVDDRSRAAPLGRASPVLTLGVAIAWLVALVTTTDPRPPVVVTVVALAAALGPGRVAPGDFARGLLPLLVTVLSVVAFNALLSPANHDPAARVALEIGPIRLTAPALATAGALGLRVVAMLTVGVAWSRVTDPTHLADALVQQARLPERFAYGALASLQAIPWIADDLAALREARRMRGLRASWHPGVLVALLVLAIRRAERLAVAMDARGFSSPGRTRFRVVRWMRVDAAVAVVGAVVLVAVIALR